MTDYEKAWDKRLQIHTTGRDDTASDEYCYPYEPTPYCVLERLAKSGLIRRKDVILDYGCGKGRVDFFLSHQKKAKTIAGKSENSGKQVQNGICFDQSRNLCCADRSQPVLFFQSVFCRDSS